MLTEPQLQRLSKGFTALKDIPRLAVLSLISENERPVDQPWLIEKLAGWGLDIPQSTLAYHLRELANAELIKVHKVGRSRLYTLDEHGWFDLLTFMTNIFPTPKEAPHA